MIDPNVVGPASSAVRWVLVKAKPRCVKKGKVRADSRASVLRFPQGSRLPTWRSDRLREAPAFIRLAVACPARST